MSEQLGEVLIEISLNDGDNTELDELTHQLIREISELNVDSVEKVISGNSPQGTKSVDLVSLGQMVVTLAPSLIPSLFDLLKSWAQRKSATPIKIRLKSGKNTAQIEYDPTTTSSKDIEVLLKSLQKSLKR